MIDGVGPAFGAETTARPNFVFLFTDDQAFETIRSLGNEEIETPNLDRLVRRGTSFTHAYNMGSWHEAVCICSRTMLMTGRFVWSAKSREKRLEEESKARRLWPQALHKAGYETFIAGKWHVGIAPQQVFDHVKNIRPGMPLDSPLAYNRPVEGKPDPWSPWDTKLGGYWQGGTHWSEVLRNDAVGFIRQAAKGEKPFFLYVAFNASHDPRQSPRKFVERYPRESIQIPKNFLPEYPYKEQIGAGSSLRDERLAPFPRTPYAVQTHRQEYFALITHMDAQVGHILDALEESGKADNTYVIFTSDHGLACGRHGLMGKQNMYDHSVRVPFLIAGPNVRPDTRIDTPIYLQDAHPTVLELAGIPRGRHVDFKSLVPLLEGNATAHYDAIYGAYCATQRMIAADGYKLIVYPNAKRLRLYHVDQDPDEIEDLADRPKSAPIIRQLSGAMRRLQAEIHDPLDLSALLPD